MKRKKKKGNPEPVFTTKQEDNVLDTTVDSIDPKEPPEDKKADHLQVPNSPKLPSLEGVLKSDSESYPNSNYQFQESSSTILKKHHGIDRVVSLFKFDAEQDWQLSFEAGQIINVLKTHSSGWWTGELNGKKGKFPINYCQSLDEESDDALIMSGEFYEDEFDENDSVKQEVPPPYVVKN